MKHMVGSRKVHMITEKSEEDKKEKELLTENKIKKVSRLRQSFFAQAFNYV